MAEPVNTSTTPNGTRLAFYESPYRHYRINEREGEDKHVWAADEPYGRVPSVTAVLGTLDKSGPLVGWATNLTTEGIWTLCNTKGFRMPTNWRGLQKELSNAGLDHRSVTKEAQIRGTNIHAIGEDWVTSGKFPKLTDYPEAWHGYVRAISKFLAAHGDGLALAEQIVGSALHGFAGTCDTVALATFGGHTVRCDYKTSKQCYARTHFRQLGAYELAAVEGGEDPTDRQGIVILHPDGEFSIHYSDEVEWAGSPAESFLRVLDVWRDEQPLKRHEDATYKARRARERGAK